MTDTNTPTDTDLDAALSKLATVTGITPQTTPSEMERKFREAVAQGSFSVLALLLHVINSGPAFPMPMRLHAVKLYSAFLPKPDQGVKFKYDPAQDEDRAVGALHAFFESRRGVLPN